MSNWCDFRRALCDQGCAGSAYCHWEEFGKEPDQIPRNESAPGAQVFKAAFADGGYVLVVAYGYTDALAMIRRCIDEVPMGITRHPLKEPPGASH